NASYLSKKKKKSKTNHTGKAKVKRKDYNVMQGHFHTGLEWGCLWDAGAHSGWVAHVRRVAHVRQAPPV
ncbi:hypothetical protein PJP14_29505, partial [Mycobacterium kansasii]